jgi:predicted enzyme related to lactoylglutathione lyase
MVATSLVYAIRFVANMESSIRFHEQQLGLKLRIRTPEWTEFDTGTTTLALHAATKANPPGSTQVGFRISDVDAFCHEAMRHGCMVVVQPSDVHGMRIARLVDPDGAEFSVSSGGA